jgi:hypothetical protein
MRKVIISGLVAGVVMLVLGLAVGFVFSKISTVSAEYNNASLFRSMQDPLMSLYFFHPFVVGMVQAILWSFVKPLFNGRTVSNGIVFGALFSLVIIPGMLISYATFPVSLLMILSWTVSGLIQYFAGALIITYLNKAAHTTGNVNVDIR